MYTDIADSVYLLDVLVVLVHISHRNCWSTYYCTRIEVSVFRKNIFPLLNFFFQKCSWGSERHCIMVWQTTMNVSLCPAIVLYMCMILQLVIICIFYT